MPTNQTDPPERPTIDDRTAPAELPTAQEKPQLAPVSGHQRPAWMTAEWLSSEERYKKGVVSLLSSEIMHLDAELAERDKRIARLRGILIECLRQGTYSGCSDSVSDESLADLPSALAAVRSRRDRSEAALDQVTAQLAERTRELEHARSQNSIHMANSLDWRNQRDAARAELAERTRELAVAKAERDAAIRDRNGERENFNLLSQRCAGAEAAMDKAQRERAEARNFIQGFATAITGRECPPVDSTNIHRVADEVLVPFLRDRNEFAATEIEWVVRPFVNVTEGLADRANRRAAELREGAVPATEPKPEPRRLKLPDWFRSVARDVSIHRDIGRCLLALADAIESVEVRP